MDRINISIPEFTRISWVSDDTRNIWEQRLQRITTAWLRMEWLAVADGVRSCGLTFVSPNQFLSESTEWIKYGLAGVPLEIVGEPNSKYKNSVTDVEYGKPFLFRIVIGTPSNLIEFQTAWDSNNEARIAQLLGYPPCCYKFFEQCWRAQEMIDTTWPMAQATTEKVSVEDNNQFLIVNGAPQVNILWRWLGIRLLPHLPCSFNCKYSLDLANQFIKIGRSYGYDAEIDWLLEILSWPVEWSALHGLAEIKTPILKVSANTDPTLSKYTVQYNGVSYPVEGAVGLRFPFKTPKKTILSQSRGYQLGLANTIEDLNELPPWHASDNGFTTKLAMDRAHKPIVEMAAQVISGKHGRVLDLGCGNGILLQKICNGSNVVPIGLDLDTDKILRARHINTQDGSKFLVGDIFGCEHLWQSDQRYLLVLLMLGRLTEVDDTDAEDLINRLYRHCDNILVYAYGDWASQYGGIKELADRSGLRLSVCKDHPATSIGLVQPNQFGQVASSA